jgi:hypothetical protein
MCALHEFEKYLQNSKFFSWKCIIKAQGKYFSGVKSGQIGRESGALKSQN